MKRRRIKNLIFKTKGEIIMVVSVATYLNGISALVCWGLGVFFGFYFLYLYSKMKKPLMPWIAITAFGGGFLYFGPVASFFSLIFTGNNLTPILYGWFSYTTPAIDTFTGMYAGFSIFNPERKKLIMWIYGILGIVLLISLYAFPSVMIESFPPNPGELLDINLRNVVLVIIAIDILSFVFILSVGFFKLSRKIKKPDEKRHALMLGIGWILFAIAGTIDAMVPVIYIHWIVFARVLMSIASITIFTGFSPPKTDRKK